MIRRSFIRSAGMVLGFLSIRPFENFATNNRPSLIVHTHERFRQEAGELIPPDNFIPDIKVLNEADYKLGVFAQVSQRHGVTGINALTGAIPFCLGIRDSFPVSENAVILLCSFDYEQDSVFLSPYPDACMSKANEWVLSGTFKNVVLILA